jgi:hypothetical protein
MSIGFSGEPRLPPRGERWLISVRRDRYVRIPDRGQTGRVIRARCYLDNRLVNGLVVVYVRLSLRQAA